MKTLNPSSLIAIEVDSDAIEIQKTNHAIYFKSVTSNLDKDKNGLRILKVGLSMLRKFEILGEVTASEISFDVEPYLESDDFQGIDWDGCKFEKKIWADYTKPNFFYFLNTEESFYSLLQANGLHFENPMGEKSKWVSPNGLKWEDYENQWQEARDKVIKGKLIILKMF